MPTSNKFPVSDATARASRANYPDFPVNIKILLVNDSRKERPEIKSFLENLQWEIMEADSGEKALSLIGEHDYAVAVIDERFPGMDGFAIAECIRRCEKSRTLRIIFIAAIQGGSAYTQKAYALGGVDFLFTPLDGKIIVAKVGMFAEVFSKTEMVRRLEERLDGLKVSEERYRRLFETAQDGILILDAGDGRIDDANPFLLALLGFPREELVGKQLWEIGFFKDIQANLDAFSTLKKDGYVRYEDLPLKTKSGESRAVEFVSNSYLVGGKSVIQCNIRDLTKKRAMEKALRISEDSLRQSHKLEAIGKLAGGVAHDFNNVLTAISGYAEMALSAVEPHGLLHDYLAQILKAGDRATDLTKQLLAFTRQQILAPKILGLNALVLDMEEMLARLIGKSMHLRQDLDPDLGKVMADPIQIQQILMNLVINARDAMPHGGDITIVTGNTHSDPEYAVKHPETARKDYVCLSVGDTGTGMDADVKARIFDPFYTTKGPGNGTGLGLATVKSIADRSGGHVTVESSPGKGSTFRVYLPRTESEEERPISFPAPDAFSGRGNEKVLLVDDEDMVRTMCRKVLETYGYVVLEAESGTAALAMIQDHPDPIDLLLTDLRLPGQNGRELAENFVRLRPKSHVLFMSGYPEDTIAQQGLIETGALFIQKPFSPAKLARAVREVLDRIILKPQ